MAKESTAAILESAAIDGMIRRTLPVQSASWIVDTDFDGDHIKDIRSKWIISL